MNELLRAEMLGMEGLSAIYHTCYVLLTLYIRTFYPNAISFHFLFVCVQFYIILIFYNTFKTEKTTMQPTYFKTHT